MAYLDAGGRNAFWVVHRRAGKDLTALHQMAKMAFVRKGLYWHTLPTYKQARKAIWQGFTNDGKRFIDNAFPPAIVANRNEQEMRIELKNGSIIQLVGSDSYDTLVGSNPVGVTFSEYALNHPRAYDYIRPILAANNGWAAFITTPRGRNHAYDLYQKAKADPKWFTAVQSVHDTNFADGTLSRTVMDDELAAGMPAALVRSEYLCDWNAALVGSVWGDLMEELEHRGGLDDFDSGSDGIHTVWDLGMSDATAIWFMRTGSGVEFVDHYEAHGKPLSHYCDEIAKRGYKYIRHWLPHDARQHHLGTEMSVLEQLKARFGAGMVQVGPRMALIDGIQAGRWLLQQQGTRFHPRCAKGVEALRAYHYEYDEESKTYSGKPAHDWSSHTADAFRYSAVVCKLAGIFKPRDVEAPPDQGVAVRQLSSFTLDDLWLAHDKQPRQRRIN